MPLRHNAPGGGSVLPGRCYPSGVTVTRALPFLALLALATAACGRSRPDGPVAPAHDVVLVTLDTTRFDRTAAGGSDLTPALERLLAQGVNFTRAYSSVPVTLPSHATLLTGLWPPEHGLRINGAEALPDRVPLVTERFRAAGFRTAAFVSALVLEERFGLARGFERYDAPSSTERPAERTVDLAVDWLDLLDPAERAFLWVHLFDAHAPYEPPPQYRHLPPYDGEVAAQDRALGRLLQALERLDRLDDALVVVTADHGEGLGDHGEEEHGIFLYEEAIHVPLVVKWPGAARAGVAFDRPVALVDVAATLLAGAGLGQGSFGAGENLLARLDDSEETPAGVYAETHVPELIHGFAPLFAWVTGDAKYVDAPRPELYDLERDPKERRNLAGRGDPREGRLAAQLERFRRERGGAAEPRPVALSDAERRALEQLGYLRAQGAPAANEPIDPKDGIRVHTLVRRAASLGERDPAAALPLVARALEIHPGSRSARLLEARLLDRIGRRAEARRRLAEAVAADPGFLEGWLLLGQWAEDPSEAARCFRAACDASPKNFEAHYNLAQALRAAGRPVEALAAYERAVEIERSGRSLNALAWHLATAPEVRDPERALALAREAVRLSPDDPDCWDTLAEALWLHGDTKGAREALERAVRLAAGSRPDLERRLRALPRRPPPR